MLTLYYSPDASSLVSHVAIEETGVLYISEQIQLSEKEQFSERYLLINPHSRVPALQTESGVLTENVAIIFYLATSFPAAKLLPTAAWPQSRALSLLTYFASTVHIAFSHYGRPERYSSIEAYHPEIMKQGRESFYQYCSWINSLLIDQQWIMKDYTACDIYPFMFFRWGRRAGLAMDNLPALRRHYNDMVSRPAVARTLTREGLQS